LKESGQTLAEDLLFDGPEADYSGENYPGDLQLDVQVCHVRLSSDPREQDMQMAGKVYCRYVAVWHPSVSWTSSEVHGRAPADHLPQYQQLLAQGYRPRALSVAATSWPRAASRPAGRSEDGGTGQGTGSEQCVAASVWHRPIVPDAAKERLAKRQANAAVALL